MVNNNNVLPHDLIVEILLRLPVKSLQRFICVCKTWYAVIRDPVFMAKHLDQTNFYDDGNAIILIRHTREYSFSMLSSETLDVSTRIHTSICFPLVYGPCNGMLCLHNFHSLALWNPATREIKYLPRTTFSPFQVRAMGNIAFGHDPKTDDYKVLRFSTCSNDGHPIQKTELYTLSSDSWRQMDVVVPAHIERTDLLNARMKGRDHWLGHDHENGDSVILYFDMSEEVFGVITLPYYFRNKKGYIAVYNEMIALIFDPDMLRLVTEKRFDMWVMKEYGVKRSWTRLFIIGPVSGVVRPLGFWSIDGLFMESSSGELLLYNPFTQQFKNLGLFSAARFPIFERNMQVIIYKESLVSLNGRHEEEGGIIRAPYP